MAIRIAIITEDTSNVAYTNLKSALEALGHTVTGFNYQTSNNLLSFELIFTVRLDGHVNSDNIIANAISNGIPAILDGKTGGSDNIVGVSGGGILNYIGLARSIPSANRPAKAEITFEQNLPEPFSQKSGLTVSLFNGLPNYSYPVTQGNFPSDGFILAKETSLNISNILFKKGIKTLSNINLGARVIFSSWSYSTPTNFSPNGINVLSLLIEWAIGSDVTYSVSGRVSDSDDKPLARLLRAFNKSDGKMVSEVTSSATDGRYSMTLLSNQPLSIVCYHGDDQNNSKIYDDVVPVTNL